MVGSGPNRVAAEEARIKLSELCYKTISTDAVEDKKHVDLSAEAFILICAAGTPPGQVRDLAKEVDIFAAHRNAPVIIVDEGMDVPWATEWVVRVPAAHPVFAVDPQHRRRPPLLVSHSAGDRREGRSVARRPRGPGASVDSGQVALQDIERPAPTCTRSSPTPPRARCAGCCPATPRCGCPTRRCCCGTAVRWSCRRPG